MTNNIGMSSLDHVSEKASIEDEYPNFDDNFNIDLLPGLEDEDDGYDFPPDD